MKGKLLIDFDLAEERKLNILPGYIDDKTNRFTPTILTKSDALIRTHCDVLKESMYVISAGAIGEGMTKKTIFLQFAWFFIKVFFSKIDKENG